MSNVLLGVTGGIAAYKSVFTARLLQKAGRQVRVVMTPAASQFVTPLTFETLTGFPAFGHSSNQCNGENDHIKLAKWADVVVVAPATANTIAKMAHGLADNLLTAILLASKNKVMVFPSMNTDMYENPATQNSIAILKSRGIEVIAPEIGELACGDAGAGRMPEPEAVVSRVLERLERIERARGIRVLITAGPTIEDIDPARYISNRSSGKMGYAIASYAASIGAEATLISGPTSLREPVKNVIKVRSASEMMTAVYSRVIGCDIFIMAAAVADYKPLTALANKLKKDESETLSLELIKTDDILKSVSTLKRPHQIFVGFAAESEDMHANALKKLTDKRLDFIVGNDISRKDVGFDVSENEVTIFFTNGKFEHISKRSKTEIASIVFNRAAKLFHNQVKHEDG